MNLKQQQRQRERNAARAQYLAGCQMARIMRQSTRIRFDHSMGLESRAYVMGFVTTACAIA